ncbi:tetratricopeptide repeat protein [Bacteroides sp.]
MRNGIISFLSFFFVVFISCSSVSDEVTETLRQAEKCMEAHPDSALSLLNGISSSAELTGRERADYVLLLTQARDKNYMDMSTDSSITFAVDYFEKNGDKRRYGKALYYYGRVLQYKQETTRAMKIFLNALQVLQNTEEYKIMGLLLEDMSILNREQSLYNEAVKCSHQAISCYYQAKDTLGVAYAYQTMGSFFFLKQEMDSVHWCATKSLQLLADNPVRLRIGAAKMLGRLYCFKEQYSKAEKIFLKIIDEEPNKDKQILHYMSLGRLYQLMGRKQDAEKYLNLCLNSHNLFTCSDAYNCLAELAKAERHYEQALIFKEKSDSLLHMAENEKKRDALITLQTGYQKEKLENEKLQIQSEKRKMQLVSLVVFVLLVGTLYYFYNRYWRAKLQIMQIQEMLEKNNKQIMSLQNEIEEYEQQKDEKEIEESSEIERMRRKIDDLVLENEGLRSKVDISGLIKMLKKGDVIAEKLTNKEWDKIFNLVNCLRCNFLIDIKEECAQLTKHDIKLLAFLLLGFTTKELMLVFDSKDERTIFKAKTRLKERLRLKKEESLDEFLQKSKKRTQKQSTKIVDLAVNMLIISCVFSLHCIF